MNKGKVDQPVGWANDWLNAQKKPEHPFLPDSPWVSKIPTVFSSEEAEIEANQRKIWRDGLEPFIRAITYDLEKSYILFGESFSHIYTMARAVTLTDSSLTDSIEACPSRKEWALWGGKAPSNFIGSKSTSTDRKELLQWLGRCTAQSNWRETGNRSTPMVVAGAHILMMHWAAIAWNKKDIPDWCKEEVLANQKNVYPEASADDLYPSWDVARGDMKAFLDAWRDERIAMGQRSPRRCTARFRNLSTAIQMTDALFLLRAVEVSHPDLIDAEHLAAIKVMGRLIHTSGGNPVFSRSIEALEDRKILEIGLSKVTRPSERNETNPIRRRTL